MPRKPEHIILTPEERQYLEQLSSDDTASTKIKYRANILLLRADGTPINDIAEAVQRNRCTVMHCIKKYNEGGVENALSDSPGRGRKAEISYSDKKWIAQVSCQNPATLGYETDRWTYTLLTSHINKTARQAGHKRLSSVTKNTVRVILNNADAKPLCEEMNPMRKGKTDDDLLIRKILMLLVDENGEYHTWENGRFILILSPWEKEHIWRFKKDTISKINDSGLRIEEWNLLAAIDLKTGNIVHHTYKRKNLKKFWNRLISNYPPGNALNIYYDASTSGDYDKDIRSFSLGEPILKQISFISGYEQNPWVTLTDGFFSKMLRSALCEIQVISQKDFIKSIDQCIEEINAVLPRELLQGRL